MYTTIKFPKGNRIIYWQDFAPHYGVPHDVEFEIEKVYDTYMVLKGPGYGGKPYGNGKIYVFFRCETKEG